MTGYNKINDTANALKSINEAINCDPNYAKAYFKRAVIFSKIEDYDAAVRDYSKAQELDSSLSLDGKIKECSNKASKAKDKDYYKILGVKKEATKSEVTKAFRELSKKHHPDKQNTDIDRELANKKILDINEAYGVLKDDKKRQQYDIVGCGENNMNFNSGNFDGFNMPNYGGNQGFSGKNQKYTYKSSQGGIPSNVFQMFFSEGSNNNFNFDWGTSRKQNEGMKGDRSKDFGGFGFQDDFDFFSDFGNVRGFEGKSKFAKSGRKN